MMKFILILPICITFFSCSKNIVEDEIQENIESIEKKRNYEISLYSSIGGTISIETELKIQVIIIVNVNLEQY